METSYNPRTPPEVVRVPSLSAAKEHLAKIGIRYDRIISDSVRSTDWYSGREKVTEGVHWYFMLGDCDVAYFTPLMSVLFVQDSPRKWCAEFVNAAREI